MDWLGQVSYQETEYEHSWEVAKKLDALWSLASIEATILKGRSIAQYYSRPEHRYSCDLDIFIPSDKWGDACKLLEAKGVEVVYEVYKEAEFTLDGVYVECHRYITPVRGNDTLQKFEKYLLSLLEFDSKEYFEGTHLRKPSLMFNTMLYLEHALWDLLHGKLTLKHIADWMVLRQQPIDTLTLNTRCKEFKFDKFVRLIDALADVIEGKTELSILPKSYQRVFNEIFEEQKAPASKQSWTQRRIGMFFDIIKSGWKYKEFGYTSMPSFLKNALWTHFFEKEVRL